MQPMNTIINHIPKEWQKDKLSFYRWCEKLKIPAKAKV